MVQYNLIRNIQNNHLDFYKGLKDPTHGALAFNEYALDASGNLVYMNNKGGNEQHIVNYGKWYADNGSYFKATSSFVVDAGSFTSLSVLTSSLATNSIESSFWNSNFSRINTGDAFSISFDFNASALIGKSVKAELIFFMQGQDRFTFKSQITTGSVYGEDFSLGLTLNKYFYTGKLDNFSRLTFNGFGQDLDVGYGIFDFGISRAQDGYGSYLMGGSVGISLGVPWPVITYGSNKYSAYWKVFE